MQFVDVGYECETERAANIELLWPSLADAGDVACVTGLQMLYQGELLKSLNSCLTQLLFPESLAGNRLCGMH